MSVDAYNNGVCASVVRGENAAEEKKVRERGGGGRKRSPGKIRTRVEGPGLPTGAKEKTMGATRRLEYTRDEAISNRLDSRTPRVSTLNKKLDKFFFLLRLSTLLL